MKAKSGYFAIILACLIWGNFILLFHYLNFVPILDILSHRVIWGLVTLLIWMGYKKRYSEIFAVLRDPKTVAILIVASLLIGCNWGLFVWASGNGYGLQASLGYFVYPIISAVFGAFFNQEKLDRLQIAALLLASFAVLVLTIGIGQIPWISLLIALSFASYGLIKSRVNLGAVLSVTVENILLGPFALIWLLFFAQYGLTFDGNFGAGIGLVTAGIFTAIALIAYSYANKTIGMVSTGMFFFLNPTIQAFNAVVILGEPTTIWHQIAFPIIWLACGIYCYDLWQSSRKGRSKV